MQFMPQMNSRAAKRDAFWLFMIGCFSLTQVRLGAKIGISELFMVLATPILFFRNLRCYRADGMLPMLNLLFLWMLGAGIADWYNDAELFQWLRGMSVPFIVFATVVCLHNFLRRDIRNYKWILFGLVCSSVISIFVFQRGSAGDMASEGNVSGAIERVVNYKLFWVNMIQGWINLPIQTLYMKTPFLYMVVALLISGVLAIKSGGRSAFLVVMCSLMLIAFSRHKVRLMAAIKKYFLLMVCLMAVLGYFVKYGYKYAATHGFLEEQEVHKYERQTSEGDSALKLLMAGRAPFFIGLIAALDKPIVGHGSWAIDKKGYSADFITKYGSDLDRAQIMRERKELGVSIIPAHSHIVCYWLWHGIFGLAFWAYIIFLAVRTFAKYMHVMPEMFGYWALALPYFLWDVLFSPFGIRTGECVFFVCMVLLHKIAKSNRGYMDGNQYGLM